MNNPNPHTYAATERLKEAPAPKTGGTEEQLHFGLDALTQATLALAFEKRTATLVNFARMYADLGQGEQTNRLSEEIITRLGLDEDQP